jgi:quinol monooxygenase YgiN
MRSRVESSRREPGCLQYDLHQSSENPAQFMLHETWESDAALARHFETPQMKEWAKRRDAIVASRQVTRWRLIE